MEKMANAPNSASDQDPDAKLLDVWSRFSLIAYYNIEHTCITIDLISELQVKIIIKLLCYFRKRVTLWYQMPVLIKTNQGRIYSSGHPPFSSRMSDLAIPICMKWLVSLLYSIQQEGHILISREDFLPCISKG